MSILILKITESPLNNITLMKIQSAIKIEDNAEEIKPILIIKYHALEILEIVLDW